MIIRCPFSGWGEADFKAPSSLRLDGMSAQGAAG